MTIMHMNVETVSEVQEQMARDQADIAELIMTLTAAVHGLEEGVWVGYSASQFFNAYESLNVSLKQQMETMHELAERMKKEINEWQGVASSMGEYKPRLWV